MGGLDSKGSFDAASGRNLRCVRLVGRTRGPVVAGAWRNWDRSNRRLDLCLDL